MITNFLCLFSWLDETFGLQGRVPSNLDFHFFFSGTEKGSRFNQMNTPVLI